MTAFTPNLRDMEFVLAELAGLDEIAALPPGWSVESVTPLAVPGLGEARHLVVVQHD